MRKISLILLLIFFYSFLNSYAEQISTEEKIRQIPLFFKEKKKLEIYSYYEYSWVKINSRKTNWKEYGQRFSFIFDELNLAYLEINNYQRQGIKDYALAAGFIFRFQDAYLFGELGHGGSNIDFLYNLKTSLEYAYKIKDFIYFKNGFRYLNYKQNDVYILSLGPEYYKDNNYFTTDYNISFTESRGSAHFFTFHSNYAVNQKIILCLGAAVGQRLYDIEEISASKQLGYILYTKLIFELKKDLKLSLGYSHSYESSSFRKKSAQISCTFKF